jgi:thiamine transport system substrate-binding protein
VRRTFAGFALVALLGSTTACGDRDDAVTLTLVAHDSFTPSEGIFDAFTAETGIRVEVVTAGDAGTMTTRAVLTAGRPEGDVMWGVDNTLLSRAVEGEVFEPYRSPNLNRMDPALVAEIPDGLVTPVDVGEVCANYDVGWFADRGIAPPSSLAELASPEMASRLVVQSPLSSSPGLAFLLATIAEFGESGWRTWWEDARAGGVLVTDDWTQAYYEEFSHHGGQRPIVVSYGSSPPAEVLFADPPVEQAPTAVIADTCFRQVEYVGILRGSRHVEAARLLVDFLTDVAFQEDLPLTQFVFPVNRDATLPEVFVTHSVRPSMPLSMSPERIAAGRRGWVEEWTRIVLR